jgi:outer membrane protein assembly factor BamB
MLAASLFGASATANADDGDWTNWRGPNGTGSVSTGEYPVKWDGTNVTWKISLPGKGGSTPIVLKNRIYLTTPDAGEDAVVAFDLDGKPLWQTKLGGEAQPKHRTLGSSCNSSPVTDGQRLYVLFKSGNFAALALDGKVLWETNLVQQFGPEHLYWDQGSSPVLTRDQVIIVRVHDGDSWIAGFDKTTGELRWREARNYKCPRENNNGYSTPTLFQEHGKNTLLVWGADHLTAHDASNGKLLWSCAGFNPDGTVEWPAIPSPLIVGDLAIVAVGRDDRHQARLHAIRLGGEGDVTETRRVWERDDIGVFVTSPVAYQGRVYLVRHRGEVACINAADGKTLWSDAFPKDKSSYFSSPTIGNGVLYAAREDGVVFAARVGEKFELLGENPMGERVIAAPVPVANRLLIRGDRHLFCIGR